MDAIPDTNRRRGRTLIAMAAGPQGPMHGGEQPTSRLCLTARREANGSAGPPGGRLPEAARCIGDDRGPNDCSGGEIVKIRRLDTITIIAAGWSECGHGRQTGGTDARHDRMNSPRPPGARAGGKPLEHPARTGPLVSGEHHRAAAESARKREEPRRTAAEKGRQHLRRHPSGRLPGEIGRSGCYAGHRRQNRRLHPPIAAWRTPPGALLERSASEADWFGRRDGARLPA